MNTLWIIPFCILSFGVLCLAIGSYKTGKRITAFEQDIKTLKEKVKLTD